MSISTILIFRSFDHNLLCDLVVLDFKKLFLGQSGLCEVSLYSNLKTL